MIDFNCMTTGIGSLPHTDPDEAAALSISMLPHAPIWPQLPARGFREGFCGQYTEAMPGLCLDEKNERFWFDTSRDLSSELERFYEKFLSKDYDYFRLSEDYASGFYAYVRALKKGLPQGARFLKGHITGPFTLATTLKDEQGRDIAYNEILFDAVTKGLAMKAAWQIETLKTFGLPVIIFIDDPAVGALGSAFSAVSAEDVSNKLNEIIDIIHEMGGIAGIHCCGNADWPLLFQTRVDIVNFDAFGYMEKVLLYPEEIKAFYSRGGALAWGIVPTSEFTGREQPDELAARLWAGIKRLEDAGIDRDVIMRGCIITPSCGMGSLDTNRAEAILRLLGQVAERFKT